MAENKSEIKTAPSDIYGEYKAGVNFKSALGKKGMYEQNKVNERFYLGDQWHGVTSQLPLVQHNVIKRIGQYKISMISSSPVAVMYSAEGIPCAAGRSDEEAELTERLREGEEVDYTDGSRQADAPEVGVVMDALSDYYRTTAERVKLDDLAADAAKDAYVSGTGAIYTYWDPDICTGLYADSARTSPIKGDIKCEVVDIENIYFGDPNCGVIAEQPYIIIAARRTVADIKRTAEKYGMPTDEITADSNYEYMAGDTGSQELEESQKAIVLTKFWKEWNDSGDGYVIKGTVVTEKAVVREPWELGIRVYPLAIFPWDKRKNCGYGESEITHLVNNQIAINRMLSSGVWAYIMNGMPLTVVNTNYVRAAVTNEPGQVIEVSTDDALDRCVRYVNPPVFSSQMESAGNSLIEQTLVQSGANDAALGNLRPDNTSAIVAVREAATAPLQTYQNRFYQFYEDIARIWADFWVTQYGERQLKISDEKGTYYFPFNGERYKDFLISVKVDVGAATLWSEAQVIKTLDNLLASGLIDVTEYIERMPKGTIPKSDDLIKSIKERQEAQAAQTAQLQAAQGAGGQTEPTAGEGAEPQESEPQVSLEGILSQLSPEEKQMFDNLPEEKRSELLSKAGLI